MKLFGRFFGKKEDDDFDFGKESPPDFSQPAQKPNEGMYDKEFSYESQSDPYSSEGSFSHDIFSSDTPTNGDRARAAAQAMRGPSFSPQNQGSQGAQSYSGSVTGHETQLILEKLDTIKAEIDNVKQRMMRVERFMDQAEQKSGQRRMW